MVEYRDRGVDLTFETHEPRVGDELDLLPQQIETRKRIAIAAHEERRALDPREVLGAQLIGKAGAVKVIRKKDQAAEVRLAGGHARHSTAEGFPASEPLTSRTTLSRIVRMRCADDPSRGRETS